MMKKDFVSVIIPAYNEENNIGRCLRGIFSQTYKNIEIIVVNDGSTDRTGEVVKNFIVSTKAPVVLIEKKHTERAKTRITGETRSRGDYLLFIDADMVLDSSVISECLREVKKDNQIKAVIIPEEAKASGFWGKCREIEKKYHQGDEATEAARFFETNTYQETGGYDPKMIVGEEYELTARIRQAGFKVRRVKAKIITHEGWFNPWNEIKKKYYYGRNVHRFFRKQPGVFRTHFHPLRYFNLRTIRFIVDDPFPTISWLFLKFLEYIAGSFGFLEGLLLREKEEHE